MIPTCLFCLEPIQETSSTNPIGCPCKVLAHNACFQTWFDQKQQMECPICHTVSIPNRIAHDTIHVVYIHTDNVRLPRNRVANHQKAAAVCCCLLIGWGVGFTILDILIGR